MQRLLFKNCLAVNPIFGEEKSYKNCQVLVKNLKFVAGMTRHFVSAKSLIRYFSNSSKRVEHRAEGPVREVKMLAVWSSIAEGFPTASSRVIWNKHCQVLVKNLNFMAGMTRRFVSAKRLGYFSNSSKLVDHRAQSPFHEVKMLAVWSSIADGFPTASSNCQVLVKN